ncbi:hypothetical protein RB195_014105 [Necator americanus]|uniref:Uncharacterized protein n=1 Tax=Necator americanus TaxID=51031 RepID=A0ABR1DZ45_NECAM
MHSSPSIRFKGDGVTLVHQLSPKFLPIPTSHCVFESGMKYFEGCAISLNPSLHVDDDVREQRRSSNCEVTAQLSEYLMQRAEPPTWSMIPRLPHVTAYERARVQELTALAGSGFETMEGSRVIENIDRRRKNGRSRVRIRDFDCATLNTPKPVYGPMAEIGADQSLWRCNYAFNLNSEPFKDFFVVTDNQLARTNLSVPEGRAGWLVPGQF